MRSRRAPEREVNRALLDVVSSGARPIKHELETRQGQAAREEMQEVRDRVVFGLGAFLELDEPVLGGRDGPSTRYE